MSHLASVEMGGCPPLSPNGESADRGTVLLYRLFGEGGESPALREAEGGRVTDPTYSGTVSVSGVCDPVSPLWVLFPYHSRCNNLFGHYIILSYPILYLLLFFIFCYSSSMRLMIYLSPSVFSMIHPCSSSVLLRNSL